MGSGPGKIPSRGLRHCCGQGAVACLFGGECDVRVRRCDDAERQIGIDQRRRLQLDWGSRINLVWAVSAERRAFWSNLDMSCVISEIAEGHLQPNLSASLRLFCQTHCSHGPGATPRGFSLHCLRYAEQREGESIRARV